MLPRVASPEIVPSTPQSKAVAFTTPGALAPTGGAGGRCSVVTITGHGITPRTREPGPLVPSSNTAARWPTTSAFVRAYAGEPVLLVPAAGLLVATGRARKA